MSELHPLEEALKKAVTDPEARPDFYQALLNSVVFVVGRPEEAEEGQEQTGHVQLKQWQQEDGNMALPFFPNLELLKATLGENEPHLPIPVVDLFRMAKGTVLVFTGREGSKSFLPDEVEALLSSTVALDPLAAALGKASREKSDEAKKTFYNILINSPVFVLGRPKEAEGVEISPGTKTLGENSEFIFASCPHPFKKDELLIPFFSSLEHLQRAIRTSEEKTYLTFPGLTFLALAASTRRPLILNPGYDPHKIFTAEEVDFLLKAARPEPFEPRHFRPGTKVALSPPENYPQELVGALLDFLPAHREVKAAYLTSMHEEGAKTKSVLVIGFEVEEGELGPWFREAADLVNQFAREGQAIDFAKVERGEGGLSQFFLDKVSPFYLRPIIRDDDGREVAHQSASRQSGNGRNGEDAEGASEEYNQAGFFGRLKRIFSGSSD